MSFICYIAGDLVLMVLAVLTLPLWLPFWAWITFRNWLDLQRFYWECEQRMERNAATDGVEGRADVSTPYQFWLIERGPNQGVPQHQWWNDGPDGRVMGWKDSVHDATQYPSKEAAEQAVRANRGLSALPTAITSHSFVDAHGVKGADCQAKPHQPPMPR